MTTRTAWAVALGFTAALWVAIANAEAARYYVVEWYVKLTPMTDADDCGRLAAERSKLRSSACLTAADVAKLGLKEGKR